MYKRWIETYFFRGGEKIAKDCPYRLGDAVLHKPFKDSEKCHLKHYPNSIVSEYLRNKKFPEDYQTLFDVVKKKSTSYTLPESDELIIHLRIGDVFYNSEYTVDEFLEKTRLYKVNSVNYVKPLSYYQNILDNIKNINIKKIYLVGGYHKELKQTKSEEYVAKIKLFFEKHNYEVITRINEDPDEDFIFMSHASYFVQSGGGFSKLISEMVKMNQKIVL